MDTGSISPELGARLTAPGPNDAECEALLHATYGYLLITDAEGRIRFLSRAPLGRAVGWFLGRAFPELLAAEFRPVALDALERIRNGIAALELEARGAKSGRWYALRVAGIHERGELRGFAVHALDIDDAKTRESDTMRLRARLAAPARAPKELDGGTDMQRRFEVMADALPILISYVDRERRYQFNNSAYERWFRTSREELRGREVAAVVGPTAYEQISGYVETALAGQAASFELSLPYRNAGLRRVSAHYVPDVTADGEVAGFFALIEDVSQRREAETALREREDQMRQLQKIEALGRLASGMAHDFANLLHIVTASCDAALHKLPEERSERTELMRIKNAAQRGTSLTRQLMAFTRKSDLKLVPLDIDAALADMMLVLERLLGSDIQVEMNLDARACIKADAGQVQQILLNLAINARDAMPRGGRLRIATERIEIAERSPRAGTCGPGPYVLLSVADSGTGMDAETMRRCFEPFFTTKAPEHGTGLGLSSVYGIVKALGGHIEFESAVGHGTTFRIRFPRLELDTNRGASG